MWDKPLYFRGNCWSVVEIYWVCTLPAASFRCGWFSWRRAPTDHRPQARSSSGLRLRRLVGCGNKSTWSSVPTWLSNTKPTFLPNFRFRKPWPKWRQVYILKHHLRSHFCVNHHFHCFKESDPQDSFPQRRARKTDWVSTHALHSHDAVFGPIWHLDTLSPLPDTWWIFANLTSSNFHKPPYLLVRYV